MKINRAHSADNILDDRRHDDDDDDDDVDVMSPPPKPPLDISIMPANLLSRHRSVLSEITPYPQKNIHYCIMCQFYDNKRKHTLVGHKIMSVTTDTLT